MKALSTPGPAVAVDQRSERDFVEVMFYAMEYALSMVVITDTKACIQYVNKAFCRTTGYAADEVYGKPTSILDSDKTPPQAFKKLWRQLAKGEGWTGEFINKKRSGRLYWELAYISPVKDETGNIHHFLKIAADITVRKRLEARLAKSHKKLTAREAELRETCRELEQAARDLEKSRRMMQKLALQDGLTGLLNRHGMRDAVHRAVALAQRQGKGVGILVVDIDHFKKINDERGHIAGDRVLKTLAARLGSVCGRPTWSAATEATRSSPSCPTVPQRPRSPRRSGSSRWRVQSTAATGGVCCR